MNNTLTGKTTRQTLTNRRGEQVEVVFESWGDGWYNVHYRGENIGYVQKVHDETYPTWVLKYTFSGYDFRHLTKSSRAQAALLLVSFRENETR